MYFWIGPDVTGRLCMRCFSLVGECLGVGGSPCEGVKSSVRNCHYFVLCPKFLFIQYIHSVGGKRKWSRCRDTVVLERPYPVA